MTLQALVAQWNARYKTNDPPDECPRCSQPRGLSIEAHGNTTTGFCSVCGFHWIIV